MPIYIADIVSDKFYVIYLMIQTFTLAEEMLLPYTYT